MRRIRSNEDIIEGCVDIVFRTADGIEGTFMVSEELLHDPTARAHAGTLIVDSISRMRRPVLLGHEIVVADIPGFMVTSKHEVRQLPPTITRADDD